MVVNVVCLWLAAMLFAGYLRRHYGFDEGFAQLGGVLLVTMVAVTRAVSYPMLESASVLATAVVFRTVADRRILSFLLAAACAVATQEVLAIAGLLWLAHHGQLRHRRQLAVDVAIAAWPVVVFLIIRMVHGGSLVTHDGHDLAAGDLPFARRFGSARAVVSLLERSFLAFGMMWVGLAAVRRHGMLARHAVIVPPVLLATYLLSNQVTRVLGILYPVVIPGFLLWFRTWIRPDGPSADGLPSAAPTA
jgi:hypothetical protein